MKSGLRRLAPRNAVARGQGQSPVPMSRSANGYLSLSSMSLMGQSSEAQMRAYTLMSTVNQCVALIASSVARCEWGLYQKQPSDARRRYAKTDSEVDQRKQVVNHPALKLVNKPNAFFSRRRLFELDQTYMGLCGEYFWVLQTEGNLGFPTAMWSVRPDRMQEVTDPNNYLVGWIYTSPDGREQIPLGVDEVIHDLLPNPLDPMRGVGPVQAILSQIDGFRYSSEWNRNFFLNEAVPYGIITTPNNMEDDEFRKFMDRWREGHRGVGRSHRVGILENGTTFQPVGISMKDMDFAALQNNARDIAREAFRMHKVMLGTSDDVNRANAQTGEEIFATWIVVPELDRKKDALNTFLLPRYSGSDDLEFDYTTPVPPNREEDRQEMLAKAQAAAALVTAGYDPHDVLETVGLPDMDVVEKATQEPAVPPGWVPAQAGGAPAVPGAQDAPAAADDDGGALANQMSALLRQPRYRDSWDDRAWGDVSAQLARILEPA